MDDTTIAGLISWRDFYGPNLGYAIELYERYLSDPNSVDAATKKFFEQWEAPPVQQEYQQLDMGTADKQRIAISENEVTRIVAAQRLARNIREYGHLEARINPLVEQPAAVALLKLSTYQLTENNLDAIPAQSIWPDAPKEIRTAREAIIRLRQVYTGTLAYEFGHVHNMEERARLMRMVESGAIFHSRSPEEQRKTLKRLIQVEEFETFLHRTFVGQKRFSIEGVDILVPMLDKLVQAAVEAGAKHVMIGMAHRGRLNVLAHVLGKPYAAIFSEFHTAPNKELVPSEGSMGINYGWTGDVKYHLGASKTMHEGKTVQARVKLANNPSHLEFVNPVVEGFARAAQDDRSAKGYPRQNQDKAIAVLIHGDAAFPGEGIVAETLNLSSLEGFHTGGTLHIIANNQIGFTAEKHESRSTRYASDLAKGFEIPIVHVSADDPEACLAAIELAHAYRNTFHKDFLIDLVGYRKWGHNEMDDPNMTQPQLYAKITSHPSVRTIYAQTLEKSGVLTAEELTQIEQEIRERLRTAYNQMTAEGKAHDLQSKDSQSPQTLPSTAVPIASLQQINESLLEYPADFTVYPKLDRVLQKRRAAFAEGGKIDWALAETLAFATILADGTAIRLAGQDTERGTFGHRHVVLHDAKTGDRFVPLQRLAQAQATFAVHNSPLTEAAVIGFEYGYSIEAPDTLVLWEAQFGDFANAGQVLFDQFLSSGNAKWLEQSGLVLLLPHGYEGQGPEHSSARLERFLQLSAENNWRVVNLTRAAQYFHLLRLQAASLQHAVRPLVIMTPKSLLRNVRAASSPSEFAEGSFQTVLDEPLTATHKEAVERLVLCTGKIAIELAATLETAPPVSDRLAIVRVEQLYPFPGQELQQVLKRYPHLREVVWLQEEPQNMGAWAYMQPRIRALLKDGAILRYLGRPERSSPAEGIADAHEMTQKRMIRETLEFSHSNHSNLTIAGRESW
ncbi:2-oxoglutarate dehydrogenase E1 component [Fodinisporobacter ferrooxydans]|uniref:2-oxoglutarate dehydrogenase E1 component n=1 Tax=Fodinisporobacter ferrooxydans TaxID=2901836 RepID=A0ABY4CEZ2_9BACL|nr:2-oxoglutarate dehydrogenase E1 component [Alicyclobacillaceae bacterium MYW30-H2]